MLGVFAVVLFHFTASCCFQSPTLSQGVRIPLWIALYVQIFLLLSHMVPGFHNLKIIDGEYISKSSVPYSMYLNLDKSMVGVILFGLGRLYDKEASLHRTSWYVLLQLWLLCILTLLGPAWLSGYIQFDFKMPQWIALWSSLQLFSVYFTEEVVFRGVIFNQLEAYFPHKYFALITSSVVFGLAHVQGGPRLMFLASIAGLYYGLGYQKTRSLVVAILIHFGLNFVHLVCFTYPAA